MDSHNTSSPDGNCQGSTLRAVSAALKKEAKRQATKALKRRATLVTKTNEIHHDCGYDAVLVLQKGSRAYIYTSVAPESLPSILEDLVSVFFRQKISQLIPPDAKISSAGRLYTSNTTGEEASKVAQETALRCWSSQVEALDIEQTVPLPVLAPLLCRLNLLPVHLW
jgi:hypothetical protein